MVSHNDRTTLRDLATQYKELCDGERNQLAIARWRNLNNLKSNRPLVYCNTGLLGGEIHPQFEKLKGCQVEVHMHEPMTVQNDISRISRWAEIALEEAERIASRA